jgi:predicted acetyltransferase
MWSPVEGCDWSIAEFFVLPAFRRKKVGERAAGILFARHKGVWHVAELRTNRQAIAFWRKVIGRFTSGRFKEVDLKKDQWDGRVQVFTSP